MLGLTISRRAVQVPTKRFATRSISRPIFSFRPRTGSLTPDPSSHHLQLSFKTPFARDFHHETVSSSATDTPETPVEQQEADKEKQDLSRYVVASSCLGEALIVEPHRDEQYMVARILVATTMSIITRMDNPKWFKENAEPHVFSQARYDTLVEELRALSTKDPNAVQALVRDAAWFSGVGLTCNRKGTSYGKPKRLNIPSMRRPYSRSSSHSRAIATPKQYGCSQLWKRHAGECGNVRHINLKTCLLRRDPSVSGITLTILIDYRWTTQTICFKHTNPHLSHVD